MNKGGRALRFGEVIAASIEQMVGQCDRLFDPPPLGALVRAGDNNSATYAVVTSAETSSLDPTRRIISRGAELESDDEVYQKNPQLGRLLRTDVIVTTVGYKVNEELAYYLPPHPCKIHTSLYLCSPEEVQEFNKRLDYFSLLAKIPGATSDDVLASVIKYASVAHTIPSGFVLKAAKAIALILASDTARLYEILKRLPLSEKKN